MLELHSLAAGYSGKNVLSDISLQFPEGTVTAIVGPNGCGKSTLLKAVAGILPVRGDIVLGGTSLTGLPARERAKRIAYLPQSRPVPEITAGKLVLHGRFPHLSYPRRYRKEDYAIAREAMVQAGVEALADCPLTSLSGGQRQNVYIAMALAQDTPVILLDEPTAYLDIAHQLQTMQLARQLAGAGKTVILVLHDLAMALETADRLAVMCDGKLQCCAPPSEVWRSGCLSRVFNVELCRAQTPDGWKYYCRTPSKN